MFNTSKCNLISFAPESFILLPGLCFLNSSDYVIPSQKNCWLVSTAHRIEPKAHQNLYWLESPGPAHFPDPSLFLTPHHTIPCNHFEGWPSYTCAFSMEIPFPTFWLLFKSPTQTVNSLKANIYCSEVQVTGKRHRLQDFWFLSKKKYLHLFLQS